MGIDIVGWRNCPLQSGLGGEDFLRNIKLVAHKAAADQLPSEQRGALSLKNTVDDGSNRPASQTRTYQELSEEAEDFSKGIPECDVCPVSGGARLGCYRYITYPIEASFEELIFNYFTIQVAIPDSPSNQLYRDILVNMDEETEWEKRRGGPNTLAERPEPLRQRIGEPINNEINSATLLAGLFRSLEDSPQMVLYCLFWTEFLGYALKKNKVGHGTLSEIVSFQEMLVRASINCAVEPTFLLVDA